MTPTVLVVGSYRRILEHRLAWNRRKGGRIVRYVGVTSSSIGANSSHHSKRTWRTVRPRLGFFAIDLRS
jgi:hypothetical protein